MRFLANAECYPLLVEPGWEGSEVGEVRNNGLEFDGVKDGVVIGVISNRKFDGCTYSYNFKNQPGGDPLFTIVSVFELSEIKENDGSDHPYKTLIKRTMKDFKQLRNPELPLPKKVPNTL
jgi:hypothetical protein